MKTRAELLKDLEGLEGRLADQARLMDGTRSEIQEVRRQLATIAEPREVKGPLEPEDKVALFMRPFRGREDVFPRLWVSKRKDKKGYSPVCANERNPLLCDKFKVKCAESPNRRFVCLDDRVVLDHLQGRHVIGVYPMLLDETCWFLAADFDGEGWKEDAKAVMSTCAELGVPATLERSRSGQGAHVWIFFSAPVHAATARKLGCFLLTTTMNRRYQLSMASYDRLFPNQDTMPQGGFGNLIALPLQREARKEGNTLFLDDSLEPYPDPWTHLASARRMTPSEVETLAETATRQGRVLGVRFEPLEDGLETTPWERPPSGKPKRAKIEGPVPNPVRAVLSSRVFVEKGACVQEDVREADERLPGHGV